MVSKEAHVVVDFLLVVTNAFATQRAIVRQQFFHRLEIFNGEIYRLRHNIIQLIIGFDMNNLTCIGFSEDFTVVCPAALHSIVTEFSMSLLV